MYSLLYAWYVTIIILTIIIYRIFGHKRSPSNICTFEQMFECFSIFHNPPPLGSKGLRPECDNYIHNGFHRYGVQEFVVLAPAKESEALCSEAQAKLIASSIAIAIKNTGW